MLAFRQARPNELNAIAALITESFRTYPLFTVPHVSERRRERFLYALNRCNTEVYFRKHMVLVGIMSKNKRQNQNQDKTMDPMADTHDSPYGKDAQKPTNEGHDEGKIVVAALLRRPDRPEIRMWDYIRMGGLRVAWAGGLSNTFHVLRILEEAAQPCDRLGKTWYLDTLAVDAQHQGEQLGSRMIHACIIPRIARNGGGVFTLVTNTQRNCEFYRKNGLVMFAHGQIETWGKDKVGNWCFRMDVARG